MDFSSLSLFRIKFMCIVIFTLIMMLPKLVAELWESSTTHSVDVIRGAGFQSSAIDTVQVLRNHSQWSINQSIPLGSADYTARSVLVNPTSLDGERGGGTS